MARLYEVADRYAWCLDRCEDTVFIAAFDEAKRYAPTDYWVREIEHHFFERGRGIADSLIVKLNETLKRKGRDQVNLVETDIGEYAREINASVKIERRRRLRDELAAMSDDQRRAIVDAALAEQGRLPAPHRTWAAYKERKADMLANSQAWAPKPQRAPVPPPPPAHVPNKLVHLFRSASSAALRAKILAQMAEIDALKLIDEIDDADTRDAVIEQMLTA